MLILTYIIQDTFIPFGRYAVHCVLLSLFFIRHSIFQCFRWVVLYLCLPFPALDVHLSHTLLYRMRVSDAFIVFALFIFILKIDEITLWLFLSLVSQINRIDIGKFDFVEKHILHYCGSCGGSGKCITSKHKCNLPYWILFVYYTTLNDNLLYVHGVHGVHYLCGTYYVCMVYILTSLSICIWHNAAWLLFAYINCMACYVCFYVNLPLRQYQRSPKMMPPWTLLYEISRWMMSYPLQSHQAE